VATTGQAYAYTGDDPVNNTDPSGLAYIYVLLNSKGIPYYVGRTARAVPVRVAEHGRGPRYNGSDEDPDADTYEEIQLNISDDNIRGAEQLVELELQTNQRTDPRMNQRWEISPTSEDYNSHLATLRRS
jgi:hypothetical protein